MKPLGYALILSALVVGAGLACNFTTRVARTRCERECPEKAEAIKVVFIFGPVELATCGCTAKEH